MANVTIKTDGTTDTIQFIQIVYSYLKNFDEPMEETIKFMKDRVKENWEKQGKVFGTRKWARLAPATITHKEHLAKKGKGGINPENVEKILMRSGKMKHSFRYDVKRRGITKKPSHTGTGRTELKIHNIAPYFAKHQSVSPSDRTILNLDSETVVLPRRIMLGMTNQIETEIIQIGKKWLGHTVDELETKKPSAEKKVRRFWGNIEI